MAGWITFAWQIEFIAIAILAYALIIFLRAIIKLDKEFRVALLLLLGSIVVNVGLGIMIGVFLTLGVGYQETLDFWIIRPILTLIAAVLVMFGARKFFKALEKNKMQE